MSKPEQIEFKADRWSKLIDRPTWYIDFYEEIKKVEKTAETAKIDQYRKDSRHFFKRALLENKVKLAERGLNLDIQRKPIDKIVIHHTSSEPGYDLNYMEAVHLLNLYVPYFNKPTIKSEKKLRGNPVWSGHFKEDRQTFIGYHWLMRMNGRFERLLDDSNIGWHAGDWDVNCRSIGICIDNDYENACPTDNVLAALAKHISRNYPQITSKNIIGHNEANHATICPGNHFLSEWKPKLLKFLINGKS